MDLAALLTRLWKLRAAVAIAAVCAVLGAIALTYDVSLLPPTIKDPKLDISAAQTQIFLDSPNSTIGDLDSPVAPLAERAEIYTQFLETEEIRAGIAKVARLPAESFIVEGQRGGQLALPGSEQRANELVVESSVRRVFFRSEKGSPIISVYAQAPEASVAIGLANGAAQAISDYVTKLQDRQRIPGYRRLRIEQVGQASGGPVNKGAEKGQLGVTALGLFLLGCVIVLVGAKVLADLRRVRSDERRSDPDWPAADGAGELTDEGELDPEWTSPETAGAGERQRDREFEPEWSPAASTREP